MENNFIIDFFCCIYLFKRTSEMFLSFDNSMFLVVYPFLVLLIFQNY